LSTDQTTTFFWHLWSHLIVTLDGPSLVGNVDRPLVQHPKPGFAQKVQSHLGRNGDKPGLPWVLVRVIYCDFVDRLCVPRKAIHETTLNNTNEVSSKFEFSHFDFLCKAAKPGSTVEVIFLRAWGSAPPLSTDGHRSLYHNAIACGSARHFGGPATVETNPCDLSSNFSRLPTL
jgi:hypothetical protein